MTAADDFRLSPNARGNARVADAERARVAQLREHEAGAARPASPDAPAYTPGHVLEVKTGGYLVLSRTTPGAWWLVSGRSCSCPAGQSGAERCFHRAQVARFVAALDAALARPVAPVNVSALVD